MRQHNLRALKRLGAAIKAAGHDIERKLIRLNTTLDNSPESLSLFVDATRANFSKYSIRFRVFIKRPATKVRDLVRPFFTKLETFAKKIYSSSRSTVFFLLSAIRQPRIRRTAFFCLQLCFLGAMILVATARANPSTAATPATTKRPGSNSFNTTSNKSYVATSKAAAVITSKKVGSGVSITTPASQTTQRVTPRNFLFGAYSNSPKIDNIEAGLGTKLDIQAWFVHWDTPIKNQKLVQACATGHLPVITWEGWKGGSANPLDPSRSYSLTDIASGKYDQLLKSSFEDIKNTCGQQKVIIRFDHEMDTLPGIAAWYPWQGDPNAYIAAWRHVVGLARPIDANIQWLWSPNGGTETTRLYYPGDKWVNYVGVSLNLGRILGVGGGFSEQYDAARVVLESFGKPVIIAETTRDESFGDKGVWVKDMFAYIKGDANIKGILWFSDNRSTAYDSSVASSQSFKSALAERPRGGTN